LPWLHLLFNVREYKLALPGVSGTRAAQTPLAADQQGAEDENEKV
jgi:hypothetical protein